MSEKAFEFLPMPERSAKPRSAGLTMVIDTGLGYRYTEDLLEICADYIDLWKLGWATTQLQPLDVVRRKVELLRSHDISVCNGGTLLELSEHQGRAGELFAELRVMGADATEISSGSLDITPDRVCELIAEAREAGLVPYCEVGRKLPERDLAEPSPVSTSSHRQSGVKWTAGYAGVATVIFGRSLVITLALLQPRQ